MRTIAIVYYGRHEPSRRHAQRLADALQGAGHLPEQIQVRDAAANDLVFYDGLILVGPPLFGRLHGIALARALAPERQSAVVVLGGRRPAEGYLRLFTAQELPSITVLVQHDDTPEPDTVPRLLDWVTDL